MVGLLIAGLLIPGNEGRLAALEKRVGVAAELPVEAGAEERVLGPHDVDLVLAEARELGGKADGGGPVVGRDVLTEDIDFASFHALYSAGASG